jgi:hypothetical protein
MTESKIQSEIITACNKAETRAWRNNIAKLQVRGRWVSFGIPGKGGSDLIGFHTMTIEPHHVGQKVAVFLAIECKTASGKATPEQKNFIQFVQSRGGIAGVARSAAEAVKLINEYQPC